MNPSYSPQLPQKPVSSTVQLSFNRVKISTFCTIFTMFQWMSCLCRQRVRTSAQTAGCTKGKSGNIFILTKEFRPNSFLAKISWLYASLLDKSVSFRLYLWACTFLCVCVCVCMFVCAYACACVCVCMCVCVFHKREHRSYLSENKNVKNDVCRF